MKNKLLIGMATLGAAIGLAQPLLSFADSTAPNVQTVPMAQTGSQGAQHAGRFRHRGHRKGPFFMGVCVGQTLAKNGVTLPKPQPGQRRNWDSTTKAAFKSAVQSCRAEFKAFRAQRKAAAQNRAANGNS